MRVKKKQLCLIIEKLLLEQEDTGFVDSVVSTGEEVIRNPYLGNMGPEMDIIKKNRDPKEIDDEAYPSNSKIMNILQDFYEYLKKDDEAQRKWGALSAAMASPGGKVQAAREIGKGLRIIYQIASAAGTTMADVGAAEAIVATAGAAAAEAVLISAAVTAVATAAIAGAQAVSASVAAQGRASKAVTKKALMKIFTKAAKRARSAKISKNFVQKAHSEMLSLLEGSVKEPLTLFYVLAFAKPGDAVAAIEEVKNELSSAGLGSHLQDRILLGAQYRMIGLIKKSRKFANEINEKANKDILSAIENFKNSDKSGA